MEADHATLVADGRDHVEAVGAEGPGPDDRGHDERQKSAPPLSAFRSGKGKDPLGEQRAEPRASGTPVLVRLASKRLDQRLIQLVLREQIRALRKRKLLKTRKYQPSYLNALIADPESHFYIAESPDGTFLGMMGVRMNPHFFGLQGYILCAYVVPVERKNMEVLLSLEKRCAKYVEERGGDLLFCEMKPHKARVFEKFNYKHLGATLVKEV